MATSAYLYPYDATGTLASNKIVSENHTVQPPNNISDASFIIPRASPFFGESIIVRTGPTEASTRLEEGVDYYLTHKFVTLSYVLARPIYGSITFINRNFTGDVFVSYQTVGGEYVLDSYSIIEERTRSLYSVFMVTWEQVSGSFPQLPPYDHKMAGDDVVGFGAVVDSVNNLSATIASTGGGTGGTGGSGDGGFAALQAHINANISHTKAQVGLGNVDNYKTANEADVVAASTRTFMTPAMTKYYLENTVFVTQLQTARQDITELKTRANTNETGITQNRDSINVINQSLTLLANNQDTLREDIDALVDDVAAALAPFENVPSTVDRHSTEITDLTNRVGLLETAKTTQAAAIADLTNQVSTMKLSVDKLANVLNFIPRILTPVDTLTFTVAPGRKISLLLVATENHTTETVSEVKLYQLTNSKGVRRSNAAIATLTPMLTVGSNKATVASATDANSQPVSGFTYTAGTVSAAAGVTYVNKTVVAGRTPNPVDDEYGDTIQKISDLMINTTAYVISANAIYNEATPLGVPSTGMAEMTYENTNVFDVTFILSGAFLVATIQDITSNPAPGDLPITIAYPT
jgi:hypothetical protein